ncbi:uncharacterized protein LOC125500390 [Athalia rosae]|uniref:uncharacterized protein LOC125500390 n=1 Tax=Athalia rosae TaxID=37344 RepID=UPI0020347D47|nr:uncharacterized protein LOC125500390 [Athalia rosae]
MRAKILHESLLILILAYPLITSSAPTTETEMESVTGTREQEEEESLRTTTEVNSAVATTAQYFRQSRRYRPGGYERGGHDHDDYDDVPDVHHDDMHDQDDSKNMVEEGKGDYLGGYYDFLINEGSYKFWAVFQLGTAALLIYSGFAAVYFAKVNPPASDDYEDYFFRRRRSVQPPQERTFLGLTPEAFQRILDAVAREFH